MVSQEGKDRLGTWHADSGEGEEEDSVVLKDLLFFFLLSGK